MARGDKLVKDHIFLSIVTPTYNEEETIAECIKAVARVMASLDKKITYEHIIIDNASTDSTIQIARILSRSDARIIVAVNDRNIGGSRSIYRGLSLTRGDWIVPMLPADLQDPAETIPKFIDEISTETNVIFGIRKNRQESLIMRFMRSVYYKAIRKFSTAEIPLHSGDFCLINRNVANSLIEIQDENPYVRGLIAQAAKSPKFVEYNWGKRLSGKSKASPFVLTDLAVSGFVSTSQIPARIALLSGFAISLGSVLWALIQIFIVLLGEREAQPGVSTIVVAIFLFGGIQLFFTGLIGEYVLSIHRQVKRTPTVETHVFRE
jgi:glycosyltransferase involved in cell wall biosynthesis